MRPRDRELASRLDESLLSFDRERHPLPGIQDPTKRRVLLEQVLESVHRVRFVEVLLTRNLSDRRADPDDELFDPLKAAIIHTRQGNFDEAFWLLFVFVHFGKHKRAGWRYAREVYGRLGGPGRWDWPSISADPSGFRAWLDAHQDELRREGVPRGFGNHRKYESLDAYSPRGTGAAVESYVHWVNPPRTHEDLISQACQRAGGDPLRAFDDLYHSMETVTRFGRTARFDYLAMVAKLGLAPIKPGSAYIHGSTGPLEGARLLFGDQNGGPITAADLEELLVELDVELRVGMQVLEDGLCNWQKSPDQFKPFRT